MFLAEFKLTGIDFWRVGSATEKALPAYERSCIICDS